MSTSQLLNRRLGLGSTAEINQSSTGGSFWPPETPPNILVAALALVHLRFSSSSSFQFGRIEGSKFSTCLMTIETSDSVEKLIDTAAGLSYDVTASVPEHCGIIFSFNQEGLDPFLASNADSFEAVYHFNLTARSLTIHYRADLFDVRSVELWADALGRSVERLLKSKTDPSIGDQPIGSLAIIDPVLSDRMISIGHLSEPEATNFYSNSSSTDFTFHRQFEQQVLRSPDRIAVWARHEPDDDTGVELSYRELNRQANAIAKWLNDAGIQPEDSVGIMMCRRVGLLSALIGVMKAGGRYVALEPDLPTDRLVFMAQDSAVGFLITDATLVDRAEELAVKFAGDASVTILDVESSKCADTNTNARGGDLDANPAPRVHNHQAAYTIYTSGSTGNPKGVEICHHSLVNFCHVFVTQLEFTADDTSAAMSTIAFDASVGELFPLLLIGGRVAIGHKQIGANGRQLERLIRDTNATYMAATPTSLRVLVASGWSESPKLTVIAGGEALTPLVRAEVSPRVKRLVNGYGPTEATVYTTFGFLKDGSDAIPLGGPLLNARLYVIDDFGQPVPPMVRGNLFIGGESLARGYLNRPELTAEKFVPDPFVNSMGDSSSPCAPRMYDSGDVVYWDHDDTLFYIGRSDHQVKLRGYRIELGEIEARLKTHPGIQDAVAMVREDSPGSQRLVAYVISANPVPDAELQSHLLAEMPEYMVPTWFVRLDKFPTNANLKLDRNALPLPESVLVDVEPNETLDDPTDVSSITASTEDRRTLAVSIASIWSKILNRRIRVSDHVFRMGADSLTAVKFQLQLQQELEFEISVGEVFQYPTADSLAAKLLPGQAQSVESSVVRLRGRVPPANVHDVAVIGMAARFPSAPNINAFWENLIHGVETIRDFSEHELVEAGVSPAQFTKSNYVRRGSVLPDAWEFEPEFFGITRADAEIVSPQIRLFLKTAWEALEHGGYPAEPDGARIGVFAGGGMPNYLAPWRHIDETKRLQRLIGNGADFMSTRTSYALGLTGPSVAVQTACSTSLVAVAQACHAIRSGQCEFAIAGGSSFSWPHAQGYEHGDGLIYSADGHCRAFDSRASGTIFSHGAGTVLLRPLNDAIAAGDTIHAVIRGVGVNNDGDRKGGYAAPSIEGQTEVIQMALQDARVSAREISYVEAHGTGTIIGDPIEIAGLTRAWRSTTQDEQFCAIGSVKTNIGHADAAAGIAGLLKVILSLKHRQLPASLNFDQPNPAIDFKQSPFFVQKNSAPWPAANDNRIAAVSAFGMGGTNAHVIVAQGHHAKDTAPDGMGSAAGEEIASHKKAPATASDAPSANTCRNFALQIVPFSARTDRSLDRLLENWQTEQNDVLGANEFSDVAFTLQNGRKHFARRAFAVCDSNAQLRAALNNDRPQTVDEFQIFRSSSAARRRKTVFMFSGQGSQYTQMGKNLYSHEPVFRAVIDRCDQVLKTILSPGLKGWLFSDNPQHDVNQTQFAQIGIFSVALAQARLWQSWGVQPDAMLGHSIGEYVAMAMADVMSLEDVLLVVANRGRLMQAMPGGSMLAVMHGQTPIQSLIGRRSDIDLAVVNSPTVAVVAGTDQAINSFAKALQSQGINSKTLVTSHGFHSSMMDPMLAPFTDVVKGVSLRSPQIEFMSNVTGTWITDNEACDPQYYARQVRSTVRFADNLTALGESGDDLLLIEMGPGRTLTQLSRSHFKGTDHVAIATIPHAREKELDGHRFARVALGRSWAAGLEVDWSKVNGPSERPRRVPLPTYPFDEQTYQCPPDTIRLGSSVDANGSWYNTPIWKQANLDSHRRNEFDLDNEPTPTPGIWLALIDQPGISADHIANWLAEDPRDQNAVTVVMVSRGTKYVQHAANHFSINSSAPADYQRLVDAVTNERGAISGVIHGWTIFDSQPYASTFSADLFWQLNTNATISFAWIAKAIGEGAVDRPIPLTVLTTGCAQIDPRASVNAANRALVGGCSVIQKEYPAIVTKVLDIGERTQFTILSRTPEFSRLLQSDRHQPLLSYASGQWWEQTYEQFEPEGTQTRFQDGGVYVFTGGLGGLARNMALELADRFKGLKIGLIVRQDLPDRTAWPDVLAKTDHRFDEIQQRIEDFKQLETLCDLKIFVADVSDREQMLAALNDVQSTFGRVDGLLHTAGILRDGAIATKSVENLKAVYQSKALAASVCRAVVEEYFPAIEFVVLFSSIASDIGLFGQYDYSAANAFLDGLAESMNQSGVKTWSINWPAFRDVGMAARAEATQVDSSALLEELAGNSFSVAEGTEALIQIVNCDAHRRVVLSREPFSKRQSFYIDDGRETRLRSQAEINLESSDDQTNVSDRMLNIWRQQFNNDELTLDENYFELGGDSLMAIGLIAQIQQTFGNLIPISHLINSPTPRKLIERMGLVDRADAIDDRAVSKSSAAFPALAADWVVALNESSCSDPPLFLIHGADGSVLFYREFANRLKTGRRIYAIESPFLQDMNYAMPETVEELAATYTDQILKIQPSSPFLLAGYSFGGVVAVEIANQLKQRNMEVEMTLLYDVPNPETLKHESAVERLKSFWNQQESSSALSKSVGFTKRLGRAVRDRATVKVENRLAQRRSRDDQAGGFWRHKKCREHNMLIEESYRPNRIGTPLRLVVATGNGSKFGTEQTLGWSKVAGDLEFIEVPGSHLELFNAPYVEHMVAATEQFLGTGRNETVENDAANGPPLNNQV